MLPCRAARIAREREGRPNSSNKQTHFRQACKPSASKLHAHRHNFAGARPATRACWPPRPPRATNRRRCRSLAQRTRTMQMSQTLVPVAPGHLPAMSTTLALSAFRLKTPTSARGRSEQQTASIAIGKSCAGEDQAVAELLEEVVGVVLLHVAA